MELSCGASRRRFLLLLIDIPDGLHVRFRRQSAPLYKNGTLIAAMAKTGLRRSDRAA